MNEIAVIGANGYIGRHVAKNLLKKGHDVILCSRHAQSIDGYKKYFQIDLRNTGSFPDVLKNTEYIFIFSGLTGTSEGFEKYHEFVEVNEIGLLNLLNFLRNVEKKPKIIFPSSRLVYRGQKNKPLKEDDEKEFKTIYAVSKFACEQYLNLYSFNFGIPYTIFRICVIYGNELDEKLSYGTLNHFLTQACQKKSIKIFGDGDQKRSFIHIHDLAEIIIFGGMDSRMNNKVFNISGPDVLSIREVAEKIAKKYGVSVESVPWPENSKRLESGDTIFDSVKLDSLLKYEYRYNFDKWLDNMA